MTQIVDGSPTNFMQDFNDLIDNHTGRAFSDALEASRHSSSSLMELLTQYVQFNSVFGAGVANLVGEIARSQGVFSQSAESMSLIADRCCDVAAAVFFAAIDEFGRNQTHRSMAQDTLRECAQLLKLSKVELELACRLAAGTELAITEVANGYLCFQRAKTQTDLFHGLGFHLGSELLADLEFNILDSHLRHRHPALVLELERRKAYKWISIHTKAEAEHFQSALSGANLALSHYTGDVAQARTWILSGFQHFAHVQRQFIHSLQAGSNRMSIEKSCAPVG